MYGVYRKPFPKIVGAIRQRAFDSSFLRAHYHQSSSLSDLITFLVWELWCAGFRLSAGLQARVIFEGATCQGAWRSAGYALTVLGVW